MRIDGQYIKWSIVLFIVITFLILIMIALILGGCSYQAKFYEKGERTGMIKTNAKGDYKKGDMSANFGKPIINLRGLRTKVK